MPPGPKYHDSVVEAHEGMLGGMGVMNSRLQGTTHRRVASVDNDRIGIAGPTTRSRQVMAEPVLAAPGLLFTGHGQVRRREDVNMVHANQRAHFGQEVPP